ncbi:GNAT family N-acetyltransferase [Pelagibius marinus]|uniref:GNAT family N-acetyltransferase n=1 Tax=Pelagibius marinus TaxID=2762760 RepID=UPI0018731915|nr:GNAT family N-acetyltransferase [Pelagibius marinus]
MAETAEAGVVLRPTGPDDLDFVLALEARPDYGVFILRWSREEHLAALDDTDRRHLMICGAAGEPLGFVLLAGLAKGGGCIELLRIALDRPGKGTGGAALSTLSAYVFEELGAQSLWLDVFADNARAQRAYRRAGFAEDGGSRPTAERGGETVPLVVMTLTRAAFAEREKARAGLRR